MSCFSLSLKAAHKTALAKRQSKSNDHNSKHQTPASELGELKSTGGRGQLNPGTSSLPASCGCDSLLVYLLWPLRVCVSHCVLCWLLCTAFCIYSAVAIVWFLFLVYVQRGIRFGEELTRRSKPFIKSHVAQHGVLLSVVGDVDAVAVDAVHGPKPGAVEVATVVQGARAMVV